MTRASMCTVLDALIEKFKAELSPRYSIDCCIRFATSYVPCPVIPIDSFVQSCVYQWLLYSLL